MGTWGPGNFDDDTAADHLSSITGHLVDEIAKAIAGAPLEIEPDEYGGAMVPCNVELLALIAEKGRWTGIMLPDPAIVQRWKQIYLSTWEGSIDELGVDASFKRRRRDVLTKTFDRLLRASRRLRGAPAATPAKPRSAMARAKREPAKKPKARAKRK